jgi:hypothetical protein
MFGNRAFLVLGGGAADIVSLVKGGLEILNYDFVFQQGIDPKGKATTRVYGGSIDLTLAQLPPDNIIEWGLKSRKYEKGAIVLLDGNNMPVEKILFENAACINFEVKYAQKGEGYAATKISIQAETLIVGNGIDFHNEWSV